MIGSSEMMRAYFGDIQRDELPEIRQIADTTHTARISHPCLYCRRFITPGQRYRRVVLVVDGDISVEKSHTARCTDGW